MKENLPMKKEEGIFTKIKKWFIKLFSNKDVIENEENDMKKEVNENKKEVQMSGFRESIQIKNQDKILKLQRKLEEKQIEISDLTDEEKDDMIELYKAQIEEKKNKLRQYKNMVLSNKNN